MLQPTSALYIYIGISWGYLGGRIKIQEQNPKMVTPREGEIEPMDTSGATPIAGWFMDP